MTRRRAAAIAKPVAVSGSRARSRGAALARHGALLVVLAVLALTAGLRWRLLDMPLERDEGEYAYAGQLVRQGVPPYAQAYSVKFPGTYYAYALIMTCFGETPRGIRLGLLLLDAGTTLLLLALGRRLLGGFGGAIAASALALLMLDLGSLSLFAHATHFVLPPALGGLYLLVRTPAARRLPWRLAAGVLLGVAVLMKQHALAFVLLGAAILIAEARGRGWRGMLLDPLVLLLGAALPLAAVAAVLYAQGVLERGWFWTVVYGRAYTAQWPASGLWLNLPGALAGATELSRWFWLAGLAGLVALWVDRWPARTRGWLSGLLAAGFLATCPGFLFRPHYFIVMTPAVALLDGVAFASLARALARVVPPGIARAVALALFVWLCGAFLVPQHATWFRTDPREVVRERYGPCPFAEAQEVARFIRERSAPTDRIAVLGSEPEIYFHARRRSATGYLYVYPLTEVQPFAAGMRDEMIGEIEAARPRHLVFVQEASSWALLPGSDLGIMRWGWGYVSGGYRLIGVADMYRDRTVYVWGDEAPDYRPGSRSVVLVYERRDDATAPRAGGRRGADGA